MDQFVDAVFIVFFVTSIIYQGRRCSKIRAEIKARANKEYDEEIDLTKAELESRLGEAELMYEELEETHWTHIALWAGFASYFYWQNWYISLGIFVFLFFVGDKYLSIKPFKSNIPDR